MRGGTQGTGRRAEGEGAGGPRGCWMVLGCGAGPEGLVAPEDRRGPDGTGLEDGPQEALGPSLVWHPHPSPPVSDFWMLSPVTVSPSQPPRNPHPHLVLRGQFQLAVRAGAG